MLRHTNRLAWETVRYMHLDRHDLTVDAEQRGTTNRSDHQTSTNSKRGVFVGGPDRGRSTTRDGCARCKTNLTGGCDSEPSSEIGHAPVRGVVTLDCDEHPRVASRRFCRLADCG